MRGADGKQFARSVRFESGFTVLEVAIEFAVLGILFAIAVPAYTMLQTIADQRNTVQLLESDLRRARQEALANGTRIILRANTSGYDIGIDSAPYDLSGNPDDILYSRELEKPFSISASDALIFNSRGFVIDGNGSPAEVQIALLYDGDTLFTGTVSPIGIIGSDES